MSISECCIKGFRWNDTPTGRTDTLGPNAVYITGSNPDIAILFIPDLYGWTFPNVRLLADHFATEINATVFVPDFFGGEILDFDLITTNQFSRLDLPGFLSRNGRTQREPEIFEFARRLRRELGFRRIGAVGYCYGGWASFRLGAAEHANEPLVDCISIGHPSLLLKEDIENVAGPVQVLATEIDAAYTAELKTYTFEMLQRRQVVFDYQHFPGGGAFVFYSRGYKPARIIKQDTAAGDMGSKSKLLIAWIASQYHKTLTVRHGMFVSLNDFADLYPKV
ncbi:hypothetical protein AnigIFM50267_010648 [Aspergillus niger]|nr:hypothetical protein AnigIFM50267_010648 [Aspergillus niger]